MTTTGFWSARRTSAVRVLLLLVLSGCATETLTSPPVQAPNFARGGGGGPTVKSADPDSGLRNTTIDVRVVGSGFDNGSKAVWALAGDTTFATTRITTNSTSFVSSGELVANITIASDAPLASFDIQVLTAGGKKGIGIELFTVQETGRWFALFDDAAGNKLRSDNGTAYEDGSPSYSPNCVLSKGSNAGGGLYQLRTIAPTDACKAVIRPGWRYFKIDFGAQVVDLDQDGTAEAIEDAPGRLLAPDALATGATATSTRVLIFVVNPDGSTTWDTKYTLYLQGVTVSGGGATHTLQASGSSAAAALYLGYADPARSPPKHNQFITTVQLPFQVTLTPMP
jgi:hypothetical protein